MPLVLATASRAAPSAVTLARHPRARLARVSHLPRAANAGDEAESSGPASDAATSVDGETDAKPAVTATSAEDIGAAIRAAKEAKADEGANVFAGAAEEVGLIEWPTAGGALSTTALVMGGIFGAAGVLLAVNGLLSELSQKLFP